MKKRVENRLLWKIILTAFVITVISGFFIDPKIAIIILLAFIIIITYAFCEKQYKKRAQKELIIAILMSLALVSYFSYTYTNTNIFIGKLNLFPLVAWTFGLLVTKRTYNKVKKHKFLLTTLLYLIGLLLIETIGYYGMGIQLTSNYPSMLGLGIMHAPTAQKIVYMLMGPVYLLITKILRIA